MLASLSLTWPGPTICSETEETEKKITKNVISKKVRTKFEAASRICTREKKTCTKFQVQHSTN